MVSESSDSSSYGAFFLLNSQIQTERGIESKYLGNKQNIHNVKENEHERVPINTQDSEKSQSADGPVTYAEKAVVSGRLHCWPGEMS